MGISFGLFIFIAVVFSAYVQKNSFAKMDAGRISIDNALQEYLLSITLPIAGYFGFQVFIITGFLPFGILAFIFAYFSYRNIFSRHIENIILKHIKEDSMQKLYYIDLKIKGLYIFLALISLYQVYSMFSGISEVEGVDSEGLPMFAFDIYLMLLLFYPKFFISSQQVLYYCYRTYCELKSKGL